MGRSYRRCDLHDVRAAAQVFLTPVDFDSTNSSNQMRELVQGLDGNLYGATLGGGVNSACSHPWLWHDF